MEPELPLVELCQLYLPEQVNARGDSGDGLCNHRCPCHTGYLPELYENQIQHDVHYRGDQQKIHGGTAVANGAENGGEGVIGELEYQADTVDPQIQQRIVQNQSVRL